MDSDLNVSDSCAESDDDNAQSVAFKWLLMSIGEFGNSEFSLDAVRKLHRQVQYARASNVISATCESLLLNYFAEKGNSHVDSPDGLNNFASAITRTQSSQNFSHEWRSELVNLSDEKLMEFLPKSSSSDQAKEDAKNEYDSFVERMKRNFCVAKRLANTENRTEPAGPQNGIQTAGIGEHADRKPRNDVLSVSSSAAEGTRRNGSDSSVRKSAQQQRKANLSECVPAAGVPAFMTAREQLLIEQQKTNGGVPRSSGTKTLGGKRSLTSKFVQPWLRQNGNNPASSTASSSTAETCGGLEECEALKNIDAKLVELIKNEIMDNGPGIHWDDIAGLEFAKQSVKEMVVWPMLRPDIFTGLRQPPKGLLLFGPPGTGKTLIVCAPIRSVDPACITQSLFEDWFLPMASRGTQQKLQIIKVGEGEKMVRALFAVARSCQPAVVFIDEIDSLLSQRSETEHESSRRIKTEFLVQLDGASTKGDERLLIVGATNRPKELDEAARRRLAKRLYIPLPEKAARCQMVCRLLAQVEHSLSDEEIDRVASLTQGYSGADMALLCKEAALGPIRSLSFETLQHIAAQQVRPVAFKDFEEALCQVRASVSSDDLHGYVEWNSTYGSMPVLPATD